MVVQETNKTKIGGLKASYYLINVGKSMYFSVAIFYLFFIRIGFQINQITMLYGAYGIASITMNLLVPGIGKKIGKKNASILGFFLLTLSIFMIAWSSSYIEFIIAFILWGIAETIILIAFESLFFEKLKERNAEKKYLGIKSKARALSTSVLLIASVSGPYLFNVNIRLPWILYGVGLCISTLTLFLIPKSLSVKDKSNLPNVMQDQQDPSDTQKMDKEDTKSPFANVRIIKIIVLISISTIIYTIFIEVIEEPVLIYYGFSASSLGLIYAVVRTGNVLLLPRIVGLKKKMKSKWLLTISFVLVGIAFRLMLLGVPSLVFIILCFVLILTLNVNLLILDALFHLNIESKQRTKTLGRMNFVTMGLANLGTIISGFIIEFHGFERFLQMTILVMLISVGFALALLWIKPGKVRDTIEETFTTWTSWLSKSSEDASTIEDDDPIEQNQVIGINKGGSEAYEKMIQSGKITAEINNSTHE
jgi:MFS family permease